LVRSAADFCTKKNAPKTTTQYWSENLDSCTTRPAASLAIGIGSPIFVGILPVVGMPLPFISYGGSSMVTICVCLGLLIAIGRDSMRQQNGA
jgi:hypothetical protein